METTSDAGYAGSLSLVAAKCAKLAPDLWSGAARPPRQLADTLARLKGVPGCPLLPSPTWRH
jgi:hypothetical protein